MMHHILTRESTLYLLFIFFFLTCGSFYLSAVLHRRFFSKIGFDFLKSNNLWNLILVIFGFTIVNITDYFTFSFSRLIFSCFLGIFIGCILIESEIFVNRARFRNNNNSGIKKNHNNLDKRYLGNLKVNPKMKALLSSQIDFQKAYSKKTDQQSNNGYFQFQFSDIIICAVLEELLYRCLLFDLLLNIFPKSFILFAILITSFFFGLIHQSYGWQQSVNKMIMGILLCTTVLITKSFYVCIIAHMIFNLLSYKYIKKSEKSRAFQTN